MTFGFALCKSWSNLGQSLIGGQDHTNSDWLPDEGLVGILAVSPLHTTAIMFSSSSIT